MPYTVHEQPDLYCDSVRMLTDIYTGDTLKATIEEILHKNEGRVTREMLTPLLDDAAELMEEVAASVELSGDTAELLFGKREDLPPFAQAIQTYSRLLEKGVDDRRYAIAFTLNRDLSFVPPVMPDDLSFYRCIDAFELDAATKYDIVRLYSDFDRCLAYTQEKADQASAILAKHLPAFQEPITTLTKQLTEGLATEGVAYIHRLTEVRLDEKDHYDFYPTLAQPNGMTINCDDIQGVNEIYVGISLFPLIELLGDAGKRGAVPGEFLKALADNTKMSILLKLKQKSHYSGELAEALGLTGATISHHMNTLTNLRLVSLEKSGNRVYYHLNKDRIRRILGGLEKSLCD